MEISDSNSLKWINIIAFVLTVLVNGLAGSTNIIGGRFTNEISDLNPTLITPAGYVFSIWGIIYILLGVFCIFQAFSKEEGKNIQERIGLLFIFNCILNVVWLFLWQYEVLSLSVILMFLLLASLIMIYTRLEIGKSESSIRYRLAVHLPFSIYLGWITIASIANVSVTLVSMGFQGFEVNPVYWATSIIIVALLIALLVIATRKDVAYGLVIIWALLGISSNQVGYESIVTISNASAIVISAALVTTIILSIARSQ